MSYEKILTFNTYRQHGETAHIIRENKQFASPFSCSLLDTTLLDEIGDRIV